MANLAPTTWHYRWVATNSFGTTFSPDQTVNVGGAAPLAGDLNGDGVVDGADLAILLANLNGNGTVHAAELHQVLADYYPNSPFLALTNVAGLGGTNVTFGMNNSVAGSLSVQYATDLVHWFYLGPATPRYLITDTNAPAVPQRYYRLSYP